MQSNARLAASCLVASVTFLAASAPAGAAPKQITGKLTKPGYSVIAVTADGKASSVRAKPRRFTLKPPGAIVTLHLRAANGKYAGPIVGGQKAERAIVGVRAGAKLGEISVREGYARVSKTPPAKWLAAGRTARAKDGVPIGAGVFGRVRSGSARSGVPGDRDLDGIPDLFDTDDDGDRTLDGFDRSTSLRATQADDRIFELQTSLSVTLDAPANVNVRDSTDPSRPAFTAEQIATVLPSFGRVDMLLLGASPELDCGRPQSRADPTLGGLVYCSRGGTGRAFKPGVPDADFPLFPGAAGGEYDRDGDGFGTLRATSSPSGPEPRPFMFLRPGATSEQIGTGDDLVQCVPGCGGGNPEFHAVLGFMFSTVPALVSFSDGQGGDPVRVPYPVAGEGSGGPGGPGTRANPFPVRSGPNGVELTATFLRPQRAAVPEWGEAGEWMDMGGLNYTANVADVGYHCPQAAFSTDDRNLRVPQPVFDGGGLRDTLGDRSPSPENTFTYAFNLTRCFESNGLSFDVGEVRGVSFGAFTPNSGDDAEQSVYFKRQ